MPAMLLSQSPVTKKLTTSPLPSITNRITANHHAHCLRRSRPRAADAVATPRTQQEHASNPADRAEQRCAGLVKLPKTVRKPVGKQQRNSHDRGNHGCHEQKRSDDWNRSRPALCYIRHIACNPTIACGWLSVAQVCCALLAGSPAAPLHAQSRRCLFPCLRESWP